LTSHLLKYCSTPLRHRCPAAVLVHFQQKVGLLRLVKTCQNMSKHSRATGSWMAVAIRDSGKLTGNLPRAY
jgi:hypothetical protein